MHLTILLDILHMPEPRLRKSRIKYTGDLVCLDTNEITANKNPVGTVNLNLWHATCDFTSRTNLCRLMFSTQNGRTKWVRHLKFPEVEIASYPIDLSTANEITIPEDLHRCRAVTRIAATKVREYRPWHCRWRRRH
jgi:hypothetical protein